VLNASRRIWKVTGKLRKSVLKGDDEKTKANNSDGSKRGYRKF